MPSNPETSQPRDGDNLRRPEPTQRYQRPPHEDFTYNPPASAEQHRGPVGLSGSQRSRLLEDLASSGTMTGLTFEANSPQSQGEATREQGRTLNAAERFNQKQQKELQKVVEAWSDFSTKLPDRQQKIQEQLAFQKQQERARAKELKELKNDEDEKNEYSDEYGVITFFRAIFPAKTSSGKKEPESFPLSHLWGPPYRINLGKTYAKGRRPSW